MSFILMFALQCFYPIFALEPGEATGISIVNPDTQAREFAVTATSPEGTSAQTGRVTLNAGGQRALLLSEVLGTATPPAAGWLRVDSAASGCRSYLTSQTSQILAGTDASAASASVLLPRVSINTGFVELNHSETLIAVVNPNSSVASVTAQLSGVDGVLRGTIAFTVAAQGSRTFRVSDVFQSLLPNNSAGGKVFEGALRLNSDLAIAAWQRIDKPMSRSVLRGRAASDIRPTNLAVIPHFVFGGNYDSVVNILNPGTVARNLQLTALDDQGRRLGEIVQLTLAAGQSRRTSISELFRIPLPAIFPLPVFVGQVRIREAQGQSFEIAGDIQISAFDFSNGGTTVSMIYPLSDTASTTWTTPFAVSAAPYFTGFAIANPNELLTVQTDVLLEVLNPNGEVVNRTTFQLSPLGRLAALVPAGIRAGYLRFTSSSPVHVMATIGTDDLMLLDQLPAIRQ